MSVPWPTATPVEPPASRWYDWGGEVTPEPTSEPVWWDGTTLQPAEILGWWDGTVMGPAEILGWWDGISVREID